MPPHIGLDLCIDGLGSGRGIALWTPRNLGSALIAWWDPTVSSSLTLSGANVTNWADLVSGLNAAQPTSGKQPQYSASAINGVPALTFNGSSQFLVTPSFNQGASWSAAAIASPTNITQVGGLILNGDNGTTVRIAQYLRYSSSSLMSIGFNTALSAFPASGPTPTVAPEYVYATLQSGNIVAYLNDTAGTPASVTGTPNSGSNPLWIGSYQGSVPSYYNGALGDVILANALTTDQRQKLAGYEAWKYGLQHALDASNPYTLRPPYVNDP